MNLIKARHPSILAFVSDEMPRKEAGRQGDSEHFGAMDGLLDVLSTSEKGLIGRSVIKTAGVPGGKSKAEGAQYRQKALRLEGAPLSRSNLIRRSHFPILL